jgi:hypothetical protein
MGGIGSWNSFIKRAEWDPRPHFGLGAFKTVKQVEVRWPSGARQVLKDLPADQIHRIVEP